MSDNGSDDGWTTCMRSEPLDYSDDEDAAAPARASAAPLHTSEATVYRDTDAEAVSCSTAAQQASDSHLLTQMRISAACMCSAPSTCRSSTRAA
jgi:hypothetical protein